MLTLLLYYDLYCELCLVVAVWHLFDEPMIDWWSDWCRTILTRWDGLKVANILVTRWRLFRNIATRKLRGNCSRANLALIPYLLSRGRGILYPLQCLSSQRKYFRPLRYEDGKPAGVNDNGARVIHCSRATCTDVTWLTAGQQTAGTLWISCVSPLV